MLWYVLYYRMANHTTTRAKIEALKEGDLAPTNHGTGRVTEITHRGEAEDGTLFVTYYAWVEGYGCKVSGSLEETDEPRDGRSHEGRPYWEEPARDYDYERTVEDMELDKWGQEATATVVFGVNYVDDGPRDAPLMVGVVGVVCATDANGKPVDATSEMAEAAMAWAADTGNHDMRAEGYDPRAEAREEYILGGWMRGE